MFHRTNNVLCEQGNLSEGKHTLTVNVTLDDPTTQMFWLDKVEYTPLPNADLSKEVLKFDSSDPAIQLDNSTGLWKPYNAYNGTGSTGASASFKFNGAYKATNLSILHFMNVHLLQAHLFHFTATTKDPKNTGNPRPADTILTTRQTPFLTSRAAKPSLGRKISHPPIISCGSLLQILNLGLMKWFSHTQAFLTAQQPNGYR